MNMQPAKIVSQLIDALLIFVFSLFKVSIKFILFSVRQLSNSSPSEAVNLLLILPNLCFFLFSSDLVLFINSILIWVLIHTLILAPLKLAPKLLETTALPGFSVEVVS